LKAVFCHNPVISLSTFIVPQFLQSFKQLRQFNLQKIRVILIHGLNEQHRPRCKSKATEDITKQNLKECFAMKMNAASIKNQKAEWEALGVKLPAFDHEAMTAKTKEHPVWVHFGAGNIFRGFIAALQQRLLNEGLQDRGIIAADTFDYDIIDKIYTPFDNLTMMVTLNPDGSTSREIIGSVAEGLRADSSDAAMMARFKEIFTDPGLQMISFTITEKGYALYRPDGSLMPVVQADIDEGPAHARHAMSMVAALLFERFQAGAAPLAVVSMDNCSHNGEKLQSSVMTVAKAWAEKGYVGQDFIAYLEDESKIAFPWSMIDKITPRPHKIVEEQLVKDNIEDMEPIVTSKNTFIAAFVNAERPQYLVVEDKFPNGRPPLEKAGVYMTDRDTVNKTERMKVTTCLNPLHTAMSVYGCMLGYTLICDEMKDADIVALIKRLGYVEGLPVVVNPGILEPKAFIDEVVEQRLPNPFMPDAPQRIATDTSQKVGIRFGETIKSYVAEGRDLNTLVSIPLAIAGWLRYLLAVDDNGNAFEVSADPLKDDLQAKLATIKFGAPDSCTDQLDSILSNASIFGSDLTKTVLADKVKAYFKAEIAGPGAVRKTLHDAVNA
jgi:fructuronate reductase